MVYQGQIHLFVKTFYSIIYNYFVTSVHLLLIPMLFPWKNLTKHFLQFAHTLLMKIVYEAQILYNLLYSYLQTLHSNILKSKIIAYFRVKVNNNILCLQLRRIYCS